jgi:hypothetical protein
VFWLNDINLLCVYIQTKLAAAAAEARVNIDANVICIAEIYSRREKKRSNDFSCYRSTHERGQDRVARWHMYFQTKMQIWVNFKILAMKHVGKVDGHFVYFTAIWYI